MNSNNTRGILFAGYRAIKRWLQRLVHKNSYKIIYWHDLSWYGSWKEVEYSRSASQTSWMITCFSTSITWFSVRWRTVFRKLRKSLLEFMIYSTTTYTQLNYLYYKKSVLKYYISNSVFKTLLLKEWDATWKIRPVRVPGREQEIHTT